MGWEGVMAILVSLVGISAALAVYGGQPPAIELGSCPLPASGIVEKLGGQVGVESEPGQGSTFFFTLPAREGKSD